MIQKRSNPVYGSAGFTRIKGSRPHEKRLGLDSLLVRSLAPITSGAKIPGIGSLGRMPSRTRVLFRLLKLQPIVYGNARIWVRPRIELRSKKFPLVHPVIG